MSEIHPPKKMKKMNSYVKHYQNRVEHVPFIDLNESVETLQVVSIDFEGKKVSTTKIVVDNPRERFKGLKAADFSIENQVELGVQPSPVRCSLQRNEVDYNLNQLYERVNEKIKLEINGNEQNG